MSTLLFQLGDSAEEISQPSQALRSSLPSYLAHPFIWILFPCLFGRNQSKQNKSPPPKKNRVPIAVKMNKFSSDQYLEGSKWCVDEKYSVVLFLLEVKMFGTKYT